MSVHRASEPVAQWMRVEPGLEYSPKENCMNSRIFIALMRFVIPIVRGIGSTLLLSRALRENPQGDTQLLIFRDRSRPFPQPPRGRKHPTSSSTVPWASRALPWTASRVRLKTTFGRAHQMSAKVALRASARIAGSVSHTSMVSYSLRPHR